MSILKKTFLTTALILGSAGAVIAPAAMAQEAVMDKAKDMAIDKGVDVAKDKAAATMGDNNAQYIDPAAKVGKDMLKGNSAKNAVIGAATSEAKGTAMGGVESGGMGNGITDTTLSSGEAVTAGKVMMKGGSAQEAATAVAKQRTKDQFMNKAEGMITKELGGKAVAAPIAVQAPSNPNGFAMAPAAPQTVVVNCPAGTTAQGDGSCMITGDYKPTK